MLAPSSRTLSIVLMALGGAAVTGGVALGLVGVTEAGRAPTRNGPEASAARAKGVAGDVMGGCGLAAVGVGLVLLLTQGRSSSPPVSAWLSTGGVDVRF